jgi:hypothetical protein
MRLRPATWAARCAVLALAATAACGGSDDGDDDGDDGPAEPAAWTVLIYGHGDHNLSPALEQDIREMAAADIGADINVVVFADWDASAGYPTGARWYGVRGGAVTELDVIADELDFDSPQTLAYAVDTAFRALPADRRALVLWNHGGAWRGGFGGDTNDGTTQPSAMAIPLVAQAVASGLDSAGVAGPLDILAFDTCLLGSAEAASEFAGLARLFVGNGEIDYGPGWDYQRVLTFLSDNPSASLREIAIAETDAYDAHHQGTVVDALLRAHVTLDMDALPDLATAAAELAAAVQTQPHALAIGRAMFGASPGYFNDAFSPEGARMPGLHDIGQVTALLAASSEPTVAAAAADVQTALGALIIKSSLGGLRAGQSGMHVELTPAVEATDELLTAYGQLAPAWDEATGWSSLIATVASHADGDAPVVAATSVSGPITGVDFRVDDTDVADARVELAYRAAGGTFGLGLIGAGAVEPGAALSFRWDGTVFAMTTSDGLESVCALPWNVAYGPDGSADIPVLFTPGIVASGGAEALVMLVFDPATGTAPLLLVPAIETDTWSTVAVPEAAGATFQPLVPWYGDGGQTDVARLGTVAIGSGALAVTTARLPADRYQLALGVRDVWGNESLVPLDVDLAASARRRLPTVRPAAVVRRGTGLGPAADAMARRLFQDRRSVTIAGRALAPTRQAQVALPISAGWSGLGAFARR